MSTEPSHYITADDVRPLLDIARTDQDPRHSLQALTASAALPLDTEAAELVGRVILDRFHSERELPRSLIAAAAHIPLPEVHTQLDQWAQDDGSPYQEAAEQALAATPIRPSPQEESQTTAVGHSSRELSVAVADGLLEGVRFPADISGLQDLPENEAGQLLSRLVSTLIAAMDTDDDTLHAATERLGRVIEALPGTAVIKLPGFVGPVPEERTNWLGALLTLAQPADVLSAAYTRLSAEDASSRLDTLQQLTDAAPHLGQPPSRWPSPTSQPGELTSLARLVEPPSWEPVGQTDAGEAGAEPPTDDTRQAYARLDAPEQVAPKEGFELRVGLAPTLSPDVVQPVPFALPTGHFRLSVEILAPGFDVLGGASLTVEMDVGPDDPYPYQMLRLRAMDRPDLATARVITAVFSIDTGMIGVAYRTIRVGAEADAAPHPPTAASVPWPLPEDPATQPDLEIVVSPGNDASGTRVTWSYHSPHTSVRPSTGPLSSTVGDGADWARRVMRGVEDRRDADDLPEYLSGVGLTVRDAIPREVWDALRAVAALTESPTVLIATFDPFVPWELAVVPDGWGAAAPGHLGAVAAVGRWTYNEQALTPVPPARLAAQTMAVVSGDYRDAQSLEEAKAEAAHMVKNYKAEPVEALIPPVLGCLKRLPAPEILHLAVHGKLDAGGTTDGILMTDNSYLDPISVRGVRTSDVRFVFLNACQLGQGQQMLGQNAGMVPSFLALGIGAAVAPLWKVDDLVARQVAEDFYEAVLKGGTAPAEYLRQRRAAAHNATGTGLGTPLAYLFFGHPRLTIGWQ
jgi:hypothetical protein